MNIKDEIKKLEEIAKIEPSTPFENGKKFTAQDALEIINKLMEVVDSQNSNLLLTQHKLLTNQVEDAKRICHHAIEKSKQLLGE